MLHETKLLILQYCNLLKGCVGSQCEIHASLKNAALSIQNNFGFLNLFTDKVFVKGFQQDKWNKGDLRSKDSYTSEEESLKLRSTWLKTILLLQLYLTTSK
ncbi:leucine-rich repeat-containing protein 59 [Platysternon megacephalum]|uniref:Leucine-rich repeat-containing protein 59 n=1 Tax=Platysternon megacephalum TaxID=55544 RepID=A0A4D9EBE5_9SAUR|nr:leucine-rich repeat-containing protein 59 [Platysternon megacephalum]